MDSVALPFGFALLVDRQRQKTNAEERKDERKGTQRRTQGRRKRNGGFPPLHHSRWSGRGCWVLLDVILRFFGAYALSVSLATQPTLRRWYPRPHGQARTRRR